MLNFLNIRGQGGLTFKFFLLNPPPWGKGSKIYGTDGYWFGSEAWDDGNTNNSDGCKTSGSDGETSNN